MYYNVLCIHVNVMYQILRICFAIIMIYFNLNYDKLQAFFLNLIALIDNIY